jgi:hypothetical protein
VTDIEGAVVGLVSEYDLLAREGETAAEVMTGSVISVSEDSDVADVRHLLVERRIRRVPVISGSGWPGSSAAATWWRCSPRSGCARSAARPSVASTRQRGAPSATSVPASSSCKTPVHQPPGRRRCTGAGFLTCLKELIEEPLDIVV